MSRRDPGLALRHMIEHGQEALELVRGHTRADLDHERVLNLALVRLLEILGEAAGRLPQDTRAQHPEVPWAEIVSLRNRLIHGYDTVDLDILWEIVSEDLPPLVAALERIAPPEG